MRFNGLGYLFLLLALSGCASAGSEASHVRTYYIAADEVTWNYTPAGINQVTGKPFGAMERPYTTRSAHTIGNLYRKAIYREYTDATFTTLKPRPENQRYLGLLGPIIHAEVGDTIKVVFRNHATHPFSVHPHGVLYLKDSEGVAYADGSPSSGKLGGAVPPGGTYTYTWQVPERAGPGPGDPSSIAWLYHSHTDDQKNIDSGLIGAIIVTARGMANPDGTPKDVDREFVTLFHLLNENQSWYLDQNIRRYTPAVKGPRKSEFIDIDDGGAAALNGRGFADGNFKFAINGYLYGNGPRMVMKKNDRVRWYVLDIGDGIDFHTPHWHGNTVLRAKQRTDVIALSPAQMVTVDMVADNPGTWLFHCHVADHMDAGMSALYQVLP